MPEVEDSPDMVVVLYESMWGSIRVKVKSTVRLCTLLYALNEQMRGGLELCESERKQNVNSVRVLAGE